MDIAANDRHRVAFFLHDLRGGGVERVSVHLANAMVRFGHHVDMVLVNRVGKPAYYEEIDRRIQLLELPQKRTLFSVIGFREYIRKRRPTIIISALTHINVSALMAVRLLKMRPYIFVVEHSHQICRQGSGQKMGLGWAVRLAFKLVPILYRSADTVGAVSGGIRRGLVEELRLPARQVAVLHNPVQVPNADDLMPASLLIPWLAEKESVPYILGVGALSYEKNFSLLIEAFRQVRNRRALRLVIAGEGPLRASLEEQARETGFGDDILLPGFVDNPYVLMNEAAAFALTSRWEGLPTVLIEAMALGTSVVATDCPSGPAEILLKGQLGQLVPVDDAEAFARAIELALEQPQDAQSLKRRAADFLPEAAARHYLDIYYATQLRASDPRFVMDARDKS